MAASPGRPLRHRSTPVTSAPVKSEDVAAEFRTGPKAYEPKRPIDGVRILKLPRFTDDRGFLLEIFRSRANHPESRALAEFFAGGPAPAQMNYSVVDADG